MMYNSQICDIGLQILLASLNLNIPFNTREYFTLTDFWASM
jgi:hypothetical protein